MGKDQRQADETQSRSRPAPDVVRPIQERPKGLAEEEARSRRQQGYDDPVGHPCLDEFRPRVLAESERQRQERAAQLEAQLPLNEEWAPAPARQATTALVRLICTVYRSGTYPPGITSDDLVAASQELRALVGRVQRLDEQRENVADALRSAVRENAAFHLVPSICLRDLAEWAGLDDF